MIMQSSGKDNPRFVYTDGNYITEPDHYCAFVMACDGDCTERKNWTETDLASHVGYSWIFQQAGAGGGREWGDGCCGGSLSFDEDGTPLKQDLYYYGCEAACTDKANWRRTLSCNRVADRSPARPGTSPSRRRASHALPPSPETARKSKDLRTSFFMPGATGNATPRTAGRPMPLTQQGIGEGTDLVLDKEGRPHIAMLTGDGQAALARCTDACETDAPHWTADLAEEIAVPQKERPQALPSHCDGEVWDGFLLSLTLSEDAATIGYDIVVEVRCFYKDFDETIPSDTFHEIFRGSRIATVSLTGD
jgi:hypothetical protein